MTTPQTSGRKSRGAAPGLDFRRLEEELREKVRSGEWQAGAVVPSRRQLAAKYGVNLLTVQRAIDPMLTDGTLVADGRRGTAVARLAVISGEPPSLTGSHDRARPETQLRLSTLGILTSDIGRPEESTELRAADRTWTEIIRHAVEDVVSEAGATTLVFNHVRPADGAVRLESLRTVVNQVLESEPDALAVIGSFHTPDLADDLADAVSNYPHPLVVITWDEMLSPLPYVTYDDFAAGSIAVSHLIESGYAPIRFLRPFAARWLDRRVQGAYDAVRRAGFPADTLQCIELPEGPDTADGGVTSDYVNDAGHWLFRRFQQEFDRAADVRFGIVAPNDRIALAFQAEAVRAGMRPGRDFGLVGFDDVAEASRSGLTTLRVPLREMGATGAELLMAMVGGKQITQTHYLRSRLIRRSSTTSA